MAELSEPMKALLNSFADWDETYKASITVYLEGIFYASACTTLDDEALDKAMGMRPAGTSGGWKRSADTHFSGGQPNPCPCEVEPEIRRHVLFEA